jgi:predicted DNA-binding transcriptional regulator AlpA
MSKAKRRRKRAVRDRLLNVHDLAVRFKVSARQIWKLTADRRIPRPLKLARSTRWRETDIARFIANGCSMAGEDPANSAI